MLRAVRNPRDPTLEWAEDGELTREQEAEVGAHDPESALTQQRPRLPWPHQNGVPIERNPAHHQTRARIPRIVLPQGEVATNRERRADAGQGRQSLRRRDVMEDAVAVRNIERAIARHLVDRGETHARAV